MSIANLIQKVSFSKVWEDLGQKTKRGIINEFKFRTEMTESTFYNFKEGRRNISEEQALLIEEIFERYGYHDIWDKG